MKNGILCASALTDVAIRTLEIDLLNPSGLSMAVGNFLSIRAHESARAADDLPEEEAHPWKHAAATFAAFVVAGTLPLAPYLVGPADIDRFVWSTVLTLASLFAAGAARSLVTADGWWQAGLEMLALGALVAAVAYGAAALIARAVA